MVSPPLPATLGPLTSLAATQGTCCSLHWLMGPFSTSPRQVEQDTCSRDKQLLPHPKTLWGLLTCCPPCGEEAAAAPCWGWFQVVPGCGSSCATSESPGRAQAGMASSTWLVQSCSLGTLVCPLCDGEGMSSCWHAADRTWHAPCSACYPSGFVGATSPGPALPEGGWEARGEVLVASLPGDTCGRWQHQFKALI